MNHLSLGKLNLLMVPVHLWITHPKPPSQKASHSRSSKRSFFSTEEYIAPRAANIHLTAQPLYPSTSDNPYYWQNSKNECSQAYILSETSIPSNILLLCFQQQQPRHNGVCTLHFHMPSKELFIPVCKHSLINLKKNQSNLKVHKKDGEKTPTNPN